MRRFLRLFVFNFLGFSFVAYLLPAINYSNNLEVLIRAGVIYAILAMFLKPLLSLISLPLNFLTFGLFSWVANVVLIYLVSRLEPLFKIVPYNFSGLFYQGFVIPKFSLGGFGTAVMISFLISFLVSFFLWLSD